MRPNSITPENFWPRVDRTGECWPWMEYRGHFGHGRVKFGGKTYPAHKIAWMLTHGPVPDGICVLHRCDNPACCNPDHLFLGTKGDNNRDRDAKGRTAHQVGSSHGLSKLTEDQVREMRRLRAEGWTLAALAGRYDVIFQNVSMIVLRKSWRHVA
jgi:hypothetical protein